MSKYLGSLLLVLFSVACGGTTDTGDESGGGASQGGGNAGHNAGGGTSPGGGNAGQHAGGSAGSGSGGANRGGSSNLGGFNTGGSGSGGGTFDPRCPAHQPTGACTASDQALACQYSPSGCLCYQQAPGSFIFCQQVDPNCTYVPPTAGTGGMAGAGGAAGAAGMAGTGGTTGGTGGFSAKVALPPKLVCSCSGTMWQCSQGF